MSQISVLTNAIEKLEAAEAALDDAEAAFDPDGKDHETINEQFELVGDAVYIIKKILASVEQEQYLRVQIENILPTIEKENKHASIS